MLFPDFSAVVPADFFVDVDLVVVPEDFREPLLFKELPPDLEVLPPKEPLLPSLEPLPLKEPLLLVLKLPLFPLREPFPVLFVQLLLLLFPLLLPSPLLSSFSKPGSLLSVFFRVLQSSFRKAGWVPVPLVMESIMGTKT